jgi:hypothetical protein
MDQPPRTPVTEVMGNIDMEPPREDRAPAGREGRGSRGHRGLPGRTREPTRVDRRRRQKIVVSSESRRAALSLAPHSRAALCC